MEVPGFVPPVVCCQNGSYLFSFKKENGNVLAELFDAKLAHLQTLPVIFPSTVDSPRSYLRSLDTYNVTPVEQNGCVNFITTNPPAFFLTLAREMIKIIKLEILKIGYEGALICPITFEIFVDPVSNSCGHSYERSAIEKWVKEKKEKDFTPCPLCRKPLDDKLNPVRALKDQAEIIRKTTSQGFLIPTPTSVTNDKKIDNQPENSKPFLACANIFIAQNNYEEVLKQYKHALQYTNESCDYKPLTAYLQTLDKPLEAAYSLFCLAILQYNERKDECLETLNQAMSSLPNFFFISAVCKAQHLQLNQTKQEAWHSILPPVTMPSPNLNFISLLHWLKKPYR